MSAIPESFYCPITLEIMNDPVCDKEGNSFEKSAIMDWIASHGCSPITRTPMLASDLVPNRALKDMILQLFNKQTQPKQVPVNVAVTNETDIIDNIELHSFVDDSKMLITIDPGDSQIRTFLNISCVIDISGSMEADATLPGEKNKRESFGLTILDIVKHAVTTVIKSLNSNDRLALITFSDSAEIVLPFTQMDESGQRMATSVLNTLLPTRSTNLWAGLEKGLDVLNTIDDADEMNRISTVMLFTDGEPNIVPPRGHLQMLQMYKDRLGNLPGTINTFGFGYNLDSELLNSLAREGQGGYSFIPDSGFVGTIFVHAIANLKVTIAKSCRITVEPLNGAAFVNPTKDLDEFFTSEDSWGITIDIGSVQTGQTKDILLCMSNLPPEGTACAFITLNAKTRTNKSYKLTTECISYHSNNHIQPTYFRFKFIDVIKNVMKLMTDGKHLVNEARALIENLITEIENSPVDADTSALLQDIKGQVIETLIPTSFDKWGRHYLPSLLYAHLHQVCNNFKDFGPQVYGGTLFKTLRDEADTLFLSLPPPEPSVIRTSFGQSPITSPQLGHFSMRMYHNARGVCFHGQGLVRMFDGSKKRVESIVKGDIIQTTNGIATVVCVVESIIPEKMLDLVECESVAKENSNGLLITPWHPIRLNHSEDWIFPITVGRSTTVPCESVFNFVLNEHHIINVDDIDCVTLGHSFTDLVCTHDYFGTERVLHDLQAMIGYENGLIKVIGVHRDPVTSMVNGLIQG